MYYWYDRYDRYGRNSLHQRHNSLIRFRSDAQSVSTPFSACTSVYPSLCASFVCSSRLRTPHRRRRNTTRADSRGLPVFDRANTEYQLEKERSWNKYIFREAIWKGTVGYSCCFRTRKSRLSRGDSCCMAAGYRCQANVNCEHKALLTALAIHLLQMQPLFFTFAYPSHWQSRHSYVPCAMCKQNAGIECLDKELYRAIHGSAVFFGSGNLTLDNWLASVESCMNVSRPE